MSGNFGEKVISGLAWKFAERWSTQIVQFIVSAILARILFPEDYGAIAIINIFIAIAMVFVESGMTTALIQKDDLDKEDLSTAFFFNLIMASAMYGLIYAAAPMIAGFYGNSELVILIRVIGIGLLISGFGTVQQAYISRRMEFKRFFFSSSCGTLVSALIGILLACKGAGAWALAIQYLSNLFIDTLILWIMVGWKPEICFSLKKLRRLFRFGGRIMLSNLISAVYDKLFGLIIGKAYSLSELAYCNRGSTIPSLVMKDVNSSIQSVMLPAFSANKNAAERLRSMVRRSIVTSAFIMFPAMAGLSMIAGDLIELIFTARWLPAAPFMRFYCFMYALWPMHTSNLQAIASVGRSDIYLELEIKKTAVGIAGLLLTVRFGINVMMIASCLGFLLAWYINAAPNKKLLGYGFSSQLMDLLPIIIVTALMCVCISAVSFMNISSLILRTGIKIAVGILSYFALASVFRLESLSYSLNMIKRIKNKYLNK